MPARLIINIGDRFGKLKVAAFAGKDRRGNYRVTCQCECGTKTQVCVRDLHRGRSRSCGCVKVKHGMCRRRKRVPEYALWNGMRQRCYNPNSKKYKIYGARGIKVCPEWRDSFETFYRDMGARPSPEHSIERIDNNGNYCKENCRWATRDEQARNRRDNHPLTLNGETHLLSEWASMLGFQHQSLSARIRILGWSVERALTTPMRVLKRS